MSEWTRVCVLCAARGRVRKLEAGHVCAACVLRMDDDLASIVRNGDLTATGTRSGSGVPVHTGYESKAPIDLDRAAPYLVSVRMNPGEDPAVRRRLADILSQWEVLVRDMRGLASYGIATAMHVGVDESCLAAQASRQAVALLRSHLDWITTDPEFPIDDFAGEVRRCASTMRRFDPDIEPLGYSAFCPTDGCGKRLRYHEASEEITCPRCKVTRDVPQLVAVVMSDPDHDDIWADPETAALHYGISVSRLRVWAQAGKVERKAGRYRITTRHVSEVTTSGA